MPNAHLSLGSNLHDREAYLHTARLLISERVGEVLLRSRVTRSSAVGYHSDNYYCNQVLLVSTTLSPVELLDTLQSIEVEMGRRGRSTRDEPYTDRTIDIDILYYYRDGVSVEMDSSRLILPHPEIGNRDFIVSLLGDVAF